MRQLSLLEDIAQLAGALPAIKAAMRGIAGAPEGEGRKALPDKLNAIARASGIKLTGGNAHGISEEMLHKILSPSDDTPTDLAQKSRTWAVARVVWPSRLSSGSAIILPRPTR